MPLVHVKEDESFENAMRRFKRKCEKSGILSELKKRQHYEKPSAKRKRKAIQARKKMLRKLSEERLLASLDRLALAFCDPGSQEDAPQALGGASRHDVAPLPAEDD